MKAKISFLILAFAIAPLSQIVTSAEYANQAVESSQRERYLAAQGGTALSDAAREDLGDLHEAKDQGLMSHFRANVQLNTQFVSNARLSGNHGSGDFLFQPVGEIGFNLPLGHGFTLDLVSRVESDVYSRFNELTFWGYSGAATLSWQMRRGPQFYVGVEPYRFANYSSADTLAEAVGISEGVSHNIVFNNGHSMLFGGYGFTSYFATPAVDNRDLHRLMIGITHELNPRLFAQLYYSWQYEVYHEYDRHDSRHVGGVGLIYKIQQNLFGNISISLVDNESNVGVASYQNFILRSGLTMQF